MAYRLAHALAVVALLGVAAASAAGAVGSWHRAPPLRKARAAHAVVTDGRSIYALAGTNANESPVLEVERFDGRRWRAETRLPAGGLNAPAAVVLSGRIYLIGGFEGVGNLPTAAVHVYDPRTKRWSRAASLPAARGGHAAVVLGGAGVVVYRGAIHVFGGESQASGRALDAVVRLGPRSWRRVATLPKPTSFARVVVYRGSVYVVGGSRFGSAGHAPAGSTLVQRWFMRR